MESALYAKFTLVYCYNNGSYTIPSTNSVITLMENNGFIKVFLVYNIVSMQCVRPRLNIMA